MSTETIGTNPQPAPAPAWQRSLEQATAACWKAIGIPTSAIGPIAATQRDWQNAGDYAGSVHYLLLAPLREIAAAYGVPVAETTNDAGTTYSVVVPVDGISVTIWTTNPADAPVMSPEEAASAAVDRSIAAQFPAVAAFLAEGRAADANGVSG